MRSVSYFHRLAVLVACTIVLCRVSSAAPSPPNSDQQPLDEPAEYTLPSFEDMSAIALTNSPSVREARARLDGARLEVLREIRAFREDWEAEMAAVAAVKSATEEFERLSGLDGAVAGRQLREARQSLERDRKHGMQAKRKLKEMRLLLRHLLGHEPLARLNHDRNARDHSDIHDHQLHDDGVEELLLKRLQALVEVARLQNEAYKSGEVRFDAVASSQTAVLEARLELAKTLAQRIKIRRDMLEMATESANVSTRLFQSNEVTQVDVLKAKALQLRAKADLKREQAASGQKTVQDSH